MKSKLRIIFMGTPDFAVPGLEILIQHHYNIVAVITAPDKPQGRGQKFMPSPVKVCAVQHNIPVLQPTNLKSADFIETLKSYQADLQIVVAFRMLPEVVWSMPPLGTFNLHASLLPQYRGAAPINWAIINGEKETGVTTFFLQHEIDTGNIIMQEKETIQEQDDAGSLYQRLMYRGANLILKTVQAIEKGDVKTYPQQLTGSMKAAPKIFKETCEIHWQKPSGDIVNFIRGLSPYPGAWATLHGKHYKIFKAQDIKHKVQDQKTAGDIDTDNKTYLYIKTADGWLAVEELQAEGKKRMHIREFFRGNKI